MGGLLAWWAKCTVHSQRDNDGPTLSRRDPSPHGYSYCTRPELRVPTRQRTSASGSHCHSVSDSTSDSNSPVAIAITRPLPHRTCLGCSWPSVRDAYPLPPASLADLKHRLIAQWNLINQDELNALCDSMPQRLRACIAAKGGQTRF